MAELFQIEIEFIFYLFYFYFFYLFRVLNSMQLGSANVKFAVIIRLRLG